MGKRTLIDDNNNNFNKLTGRPIGIANSVVRKHGTLKTDCRQKGSIDSLQFK